MTGALIFYRDTSVTSTVESVVSSTGGDSCTIRGFNIINSNTYPVYLKFYNIASGSVTVGTSTITGLLQIPQNGSIFENQSHLYKDGDGNITGDGGLRYLNFDTALSIACTKNLADSDTTNVTTGIYVELQIQKI